MTAINHNQKSVQFWWVPLVIGVLFILFGISIIKSPIDSFLGMSVFIGIILAISGAAEIYFFGVHRTRLSDWSWFISGGLIDLILGVILIVNPKLILIILTLLLSLWLIFRAIVSIRRAIILKNLDNKKWLSALVFGLLILVLAVLLIWNPEIIGAAFALWIAIGFIGFGVYRVFMAFNLRQFRG